jgi:hypothetical protein
MMKVTTPLIQVKVLVNGKFIQEYHKDQQIFVEGRKGSNFELSLKNLTCRRILVHPTVDGLSAMTGEEASRNDHSHGYVLGPYQDATIPGWRLDNDSVAQFFFAGEGKSYAEKTGRPLNKGVIAAAVWEEKHVNYGWYMSDPKWVLEPLEVKWGLRGSHDYNPHGVTTGDIMPETNTVYSCNVSKGDVEKTRGTLGPHQNRLYSDFTPQQNLGTGFGRKADHQVYNTHFTPERDEPNGIAVIYYDDFRGLGKRGIRVRRSAVKDRRVSMPNPFPKDEGCVPPHGWRS